jgi:hypothetical protein
MAFLNNNQQTDLKSKGWDVNPDGAYINLYPEDFSGSSWEEICQQINAPVDCGSVTILYFCTKIENNEL